MTNSIPEKLLALLKEAKEKGNLKIEAIPITDNIEEDVVCIPLPDYEDLIRDQTSLELLLTLHDKLSSYNYGQVLEAVKQVRNIVSVADQISQKPEASNE
ncbi:MAG: hypothetical protein J6B49_01080 [Phascolarctobacterium sp.]|nr:hypothetical protein [Phascolarctobacterium sp.]